VQASFINLLEYERGEDMNKTNKHWYPSDQDGNYYRLIDGVLLFSPMNADGSRDTEEGQVDFELLQFETREYEKDGQIMTTLEYLKAIEDELKSKE
jgi:hypothetical protein